ncbi:nectin-4 isoform X1 [Ictalurus punctatus]|uniref:Nectin-4 isoform X1 n=1 Tax=Ictalurus punctatus TaxID=7998 RepID=A0A2D0T7N4_ICTPU|nr:nectin-4 isoform X1 [Ictalurus punctatus]
MDEMKKMSNPACFALLLTAVIACVCGEFIQPPPSMALRAFAEDETRLPCEFKPQDGAKVIQVTWSAEKAKGVKEQVITRHMTEGLQEFPSFAGRVRFTSSDPIKDSTLLILSTRESDQATYTCHITTFPSGNFDRQISLTVWRIPISTLEPVILEEGQSFRAAATCRAIGLPPPRLTWDTDVPGQSQNRSSEDGVVTSQYSLHPLRNMNGRKLDCLVWHPALEHPRRLSNTLVVHFPPDAMVSGYDQSWSVNQKGAELKCEGVGNPQPHNFTWTRKGGVLPKDVSVEGNRLVFTRPLNKTDEGVYECEARNTVGSVKTEVNVKIPVTKPSQLEASFNNLLLIIVGGAAGALVVVMAIIILLVTCHHRRRTRKLKSELTEKKEEINNLSRQNSMRRLNSVSTDPRIQTEESTLIRMSSPIKSSVFSLEENSIICEHRDGFREGEYDSLGRPAIYPSCHFERGSGRRKQTEVENQDHIQRVASYVKNYSMTLDAELCRDQSPPPLSISSGGSRERGTGNDVWGQREGMPEGEEGDCTSDSHQISEAISNYFHYSNGVLQPKPHPNAILLHKRGQII